MSRARRSAAAQTIGVVAALGLASVARRGTMLSSPLAWALVAALGACVVGIAATMLTGEVGPWVAASFVACAVLAPAAAAGLSSPGARMLTMSLAPAAVFVAAMWLRVATGMPRWPVPLALAGAVTAIAADLLFRDPDRELRCHPLCVSNPWVIARDHFETELARTILVAVSAVVIVRAALALTARRPELWRAGLVALVSAAVALSSIDNLFRERRRPGSDLATRLSALQLACVTIAVGCALLPVAVQVADRRRASRWVSELRSAAAGPAVLDRIRVASGDQTVRLIDERPSPRLRDDHTTTTLSRGGANIATLAHRPESAGRVRAVLSSPIIAALENEVLLSTAQRDLEEVHMARRSAVAAADDASLSLQRNLHDGAQQRLIVLGMELSTLSQAAEPERRAALEQAVESARAALSGLRLVAHGALPPVLDDEGLGEALVSLAEQSPSPVELSVGDVAGLRFAPEIERAAYRFATTCAAVAAAHGHPLVVSVTVTHAREAELVVTTTSPGIATYDRSDDDRVSAAGGSIRSVAIDLDMTYEARFPCV